MIVLVRDLLRISRWTFDSVLSGLHCFLLSSRGACLFIVLSQAHDRDTPAVDDFCITSDEPVWASQAFS
jgi:hypothetical protein